MQGVRVIFRQNLKQWRHLSRSATSGAVQGGLEQKSGDVPLTVPPPSGVDKPVSPKIEKLVTEISALNLLEVSELSTVLKRRLNLPDAPVMPMGGFIGGGAAAKSEEEDEAPKKVQTSFTVKLVSFDEKQKIALIKEVKNLMEGFNLVQAKKFVESVPTVVKADLGKDEAEKLKEALAKVGANIEIS